MRPPFRAQTVADEASHPFAALQSCPVQLNLWKGTTVPPGGAKGAEFTSNRIPARSSGSWPPAAERGVPRGGVGVAVVQAPPPMHRACLADSQPCAVMLRFGADPGTRGPARSCARVTTGGPASGRVGVAPPWWQLIDIDVHVISDRRIVRIRLPTANSCFLLLCSSRNRLASWIGDVGCDGSYQRPPFGSRAVARGRWGAAAALGSVTRLGRARQLKNGAAARAPASLASPTMAAAGTAAASPSPTRAPAPPGPAMGAMPSKLRSIPILVQAPRRRAWRPSPATPTRRRRPSLLC
jgi:hypothetical protein